VLRVVLLAAAGLLLAGCFVSERPMFPPNAAEPVFGDGGRYLTFENRGGYFDPDETIELRRRSDGRYAFIDEKQRESLVSFHAMPGGLHVGQLGPERENGGYGYAIFRVVGNEAFVHVLDCEKQDPAVLAKHGVERRGRECLLDRVSDPVGLFSALKLGEPGSKMVRL
jgi:hypothetical protein